MHATKVKENGVVVYESLHFSPNFIEYVAELGETNTNGVYY